MARISPLKQDDLKSRKLWYGIGTSGAIVGCAMMAAKWPAFAVNLSTTLSSLIAVYAVYSGINVGSKYLQGKVAPTVTEKPPEGQPVEEVPEE